MIKRTILTLMIVFGSMFVPLSSAAISPTFGDVLGGVDCSRAPNAAVCHDKNPSSDPIAGAHGILIKITNIVAWAAGIAALILIIVSGLRFITAGGDSNKVASARSAIFGAVVGLIVIVLARQIINYVVSRV